MSKPNKRVRGRTEAPLVKQSGSMRRVSKALALFCFLTFRDDVLIYAFHTFQYITFIIFKKTYMVFEYQVNTWVCDSSKIVKLMTPQGGDVLR